ININPFLESDDSEAVSLQPLVDDHLDRQPVLLRSFENSRVALAANSIRDYFPDESSFVHLVAVNSSRHTNQKETVVV
ncbi:hypothetical protein PENTCL1PPCAC_9569, partial [Pristionchus entomophagus]